MLQALLLAIWAGLCTWDQFGPHLGFRKPLLASVGVGIILGDMTTAIMIGATMELMWLGVNNIGAYVPPDVISGTIVGAALGIMGSTDTASAIALAVAIGIPTATLVQQLNILVMTTNVSLVHAADKAVLSGKFNAVNKYFWAGAFCFFLTRAVPVFIATGIGSFVIEDIMAFLQNQVPWVLSGFSTAGGMMPAVGLAMLLTMTPHHDDEEEHVDLPAHRLCHGGFPQRSHCRHRSCSLRSRRRLGRHHRGPEEPARPCGRSAC